MPHDDHELARLELLVTEDAAPLSETRARVQRVVGGLPSYRLLRKMRPSVEKVLRAIQKHVISFSLRASGAAGSAGFSYVGSSSSSSDSLGSTLSTRPSVEGRLSTAGAVSSHT